MDTIPYFLAEPTNGVEYLDVEEFPTVAVKLTDHPMNKLADAFDTAYGAIFPTLATNGIHPAGPAIALYTTMPTEIVSLEVGIPVDRELPAAITTESGIVIEPSVLPAGNIARYTYMGAYDGLAGAWGTMMEAMAADGFQPELPFWEVYVTEPNPEMDPATLRTDLVTRVRS